MGHIEYYRKFIKGYVKVAAPMENILKKDVKIQWRENFQENMKNSKKNTVSIPILVFIDWEKEFHLHKPDVFHFRIFGSKDWAIIPTEKKKDLKPQSQECLFVGYSKYSKGYKMINMSTQRDFI